MKRMSVFERFADPSRSLGTHRGGVEVVSKRKVAC